MTETAYDLINHLVIDEEQFAYVDLTKMLSSAQVSKLPYSIRILPLRICASKNTKYAQCC